nr:reverse transcriptase domain-containing protein [Tanacetum cinerariifolium]
MGMQGIARVYGGRGRYKEPNGGDEADLFLLSDNSIPPGIENVADDPEGDIRFLEELLINDSILSHESFDSNFEDNPSISRPPPEPPDAETDAGEAIPVVMNEKDEDVGYSSFIFVIYHEMFPLLLSAESEDTIFDPDPKDQEKTTFTCPYGTFAYKRMSFGLCNAPGTFQRCMMAIFHDMIERTMEVFMDDFSVFGNSFSQCLTNLENMLKRCEDTKLALNWEKCHFMVIEGIVLGHKISKKGIEVDKAKIKVISKLPHPTTVKRIRSFLGHAGFYRRFIKDFSKISRSMTHLLEKNSPFIFSNECIQAFRTLKDKLTEAPILIAPNWDQPFELMCDASDFAVGAVLGQRIEKHF